MDIKNIPFKNKQELRNAVWDYMKIKVARGTLLNSVRVINIMKLGFIIAFCMGLFCLPKLFQMLIKM